MTAQVNRAARELKAYIDEKAKVNYDETFEVHRHVHTMRDEQLNEILARLPTQPTPPSSPAQ